ncbi:MAG: GNAT family N-acetyltransferase [Patescibacteria group bacterium]
MNIRPATLADFEELYSLGKATPELKVSATEDFMEPDEFKWAITNPNGVFILAETENQKVGFIYANAKDLEEPFEKNKCACLVYIAVKPEFRHHGIAKKLYLECEKKLKEFGISNIYTWANTESDGAIIEFMKKNGYNTGHKYVWMDKKIA